MIREWHAFGFLIFIWLIGCAGLSYQEPLTGPRARVRFVTDTRDLTILRTYDDVGCTQNETEWMRLRVGPYLTSTRKTLGMPLAKYHENAFKEVFVEAKKQINGLIIGSEVPFSIYFLTTYYCGVPFFYTFAENKDYEVSFRWDREQCSATISEITVDDGGSYTLSEIAKFDNQIHESNKGCMTQLKKRRLY
jgi:hypothetical protein